jgi:hypothetical protein
VTLEPGFGRQEPPGSGYGGYLITDQASGDFELRIEANPDWPADTGVMVRRRRDTWEGLQVLVDHSRSGSIGGFYGNGIGGFHAVPFALDVDLTRLQLVVPGSRRHRYTSGAPFTSTTTG